MCPRTCIQFTLPARLLSLPVGAPWASFTESLLVSLPLGGATRAASQAEGGKQSRSKVFCTRQESSGFT